MTKRVSKSRRAFTKSMLALPAAASYAVAAQPANSNGGPKVLRYAFRVAETGFDPAQVNDFYSSSIIGNIFDAPLAYDFLARPDEDRAEHRRGDAGDFQPTSRRSRFASAPASTFRITRRSRAKSASWSPRTTCTRSSASTTRSSRVRTSLCLKTRKFSACPRFELLHSRVRSSTMTARSKACGRWTATRCASNWANPGHASTTTWPTARFLAQWRAKWTRCTTRSR